MLREGETRYSWTATQTTTPTYQLTRYTFTGQYSYMDDPSTTAVEGFGLMYYGARMYDPALGRFSSPDTIIPESQGTQAYDRYAYTSNNPLRYTDPTGHSAWQGDGGGSDACDLDCIRAHRQGDKQRKTPGIVVRGSYNLGAFQLYPSSYDYFTYAAIAESGYSGYALSGAPTYDDLIFGHMANSNQVAAGAWASLPSVILDLNNVVGPSIQKAVSPYSQQVSIEYSKQYYNVPYLNGTTETTITGLVIRNLSHGVVNYSVFMKSPSNNLASGFFAAGPGESVYAPLITNYAIRGNVSIEINAFTGCTGSCLVSNPPPPSLYGNGSFNVIP